MSIKRMKEIPWPLASYCESAVAFQIGSKLEDFHQRGNMPREPRRLLRS
jgi:hypothetical protein